MDQIVKIASTAALQVLPLLKRAAEQDPSVSVETARKRARLCLYKNIHSDTLYGALGRPTVLTGPKGQVDFFHVNPLPLFVKAAERSHSFFNFMKGLVGYHEGGPIPYALYTDAVTPRNNL